MKHGVSVFVAIPFLLVHFSNLLARANRFIINSVAKVEIWMKKQ